MTKIETIGLMVYRAQVDITADNADVDVNVHDRSEESSGGDTAGEETVAAESEKSDGDEYDNCGE